MTLLSAICPVGFYIANVCEMGKCLGGKYADEELYNWSGTKFEAIIVHVFVFFMQDFCMSVFF